MDYILYLLRALYRKFWWIMLGTALVTAFIIYKTKGMQGNYNVEATLYTGVVSGYGIEENFGCDTIYRKLLQKKEPFFSRTVRFSSMSMDFAAFS